MTLGVSRGFRLSSEQQLMPNPVVVHSQFHTAMREAFGGPFDGTSSPRQFAVGLLEFDGGHLTKSQDRSVVYEPLWMLPPCFHIVVLHLLVQCPPAQSSQTLDCRVDRILEGIFFAHLPFSHEALTVIKILLSDGLVKKRPYLAAQRTGGVVSEHKKTKQQKTTKQTTPQTKTHNKQPQDKNQTTSQCSWKSKRWNKWNTTPLISQNDSTRK